MEEFKGKGTSFVKERLVQEGLQKLKVRIFASLTLIQ